jgi:UDP-N-acetylmuramoylalanine--D-glutamate ligase
MADEFAGRRVLVCGYGVAGRSAVAALSGVGASVAVASDGPAPGEGTGAGDWLGALDRVPDDVDLVVASPGYRPSHPLLVDALSRGIPVWGEVELAWQLRADDGGAAWLALTGTNGKTTTVHMLESMLLAAGLRATAVGNVGEPLIDAVVAEHPYDVLAVELSSQQLHWASIGMGAPSIRPAAGALLNLAPDHLDWHGSLEGYERAKAAIWGGAGSGTIAIGNADDPRVAALLPAGAVSFTLGEPAEGQLGVVGEQLVSRAFGDENAGGVVLAEAGQVRPAGRHNIANALAAAALARAHGVPAAAVTEGLHTFVPDPHRNALVAVRHDITWVDDSKATNPHAAQASLSAYPHIVWIAGGQLKGVDDRTLGELIAGAADRLRGAVLLGQDRDQLAASLRRHAPDIPAIMVDNVDDGVMVEVVRAAADLARPGDTVLLAPAAASYDMFTNYGARGDAFAAAVRELTEDPA